MSVNAIPEGYHSVTPYLVVDGASDALAWYAKAFGAVEKFRMPIPGGKVGNAEFLIGNSHVMIADAMPEMGIKGPGAYGGSPVSILIYLEDVDATYEKAVENGAEVLKPLQDQPYGDRSGTLKDPFGLTWTVATHIEDVSLEEVQERMANPDGSCQN